MSNVNTLKAIQCLIGSNCIVSTPDAFYVGPKGLISTAEIVQTLDEHNNKINNNTSNINAIQADLNGINNDVNSIKAVLSNINNDIQLLKDTDDAIYETFDEISGYISNNTQNIQNHDETILSIQQTIVQLQDDTAVHDLSIKENTKDINCIKEFQPTTIDLEVDETNINNLSTGYYAIKDVTLGEQYSSIVGHIRMYDPNTALVTGLILINPEGNIYPGPAINNMFKKVNGSWEEV